MVTFTEGFTAGHFLASEAPGMRSRDAIILANAAGAEATFKAGLVLARRTVGAATRAAKSGGNAANTGDMTLDVTTPVLAGAQVGVYTVRCIAAASNSGTFRVTDPRGNVLGDVAVAATFANQIKFVIADSTQDFIVGEGFDVTIAAGDGDYIPFTNAANLPAAGVLWEGRIIPATTDAAAVAVTRDAEVVADRLQYDATLVTDALTAAKAAARISLAAAGIILR